jgi:FkbM family methyltransferase
MKKYFRKIGFSWVALMMAKLIELIQLYSFKDGIHIFLQLYKKRKSYVLYPSFLKAPILLRNNISDRAIFLQVFIEKQYAPVEYDYPEIETIIDGGANIGTASVFFANKFPKAEILAVEPNDENYELLCKNTKAYSSVQCYHGAIWDANEDIYITNPESLAAGFTVERSADNTTLKGNTIDTLLKLKNWKTVDLLKIDIEGAEKEVFAADISWLKGVKLLIIELHDRYKPGCAKSVFNALNGYDYESFFHHENIFIKFNHQ